MQEKNLKKTSLKGRGNGGKTPLKKPSDIKMPKDKSEKYDAYKKKSNSQMKRVNLKAGALLSPLPAVMVTLGDMEKSNIITIGWCGILSTNPPRAYISVRPSRHSYKILCEKKEFVINLTTENLAKATDYAGIYTGAKVDKFEKLGLTRVESSEVLAPSIAESPLSIECRVFDIIESGTHHIFMADIVSVSCREDIIKDGKISLDKAGLLAYAHGEYFALGKKVGKFGFSATKSKKRK